MQQKSKLVKSYIDHFCSYDPLASRYSQLETEVSLER